MATKKNLYYDMMLGSFIASALIILLIIIFLIGKERRLFDNRVEIEAHFPNVAGLAVGADVMLSGVVVGHVNEIKFPIMRTDLPNALKDIRIIMRVSSSAMKWIREDSIARIDSKGLLGDKLINISIGSVDNPQVEPRGMLKSVPPLDLNKSLEQAQKILENVTETVSDAKDIFKSFTKEGGDLALAKLAKSARRILEEIENGQGSIHELIYNKESGEDTKKIIVSLKEIMNSFEDISKKAKSGPNIIHSLFYDNKGKEVVMHLEKSLDTLASLLKEVKTGSGIIHELIYAKDESNFLRSLNKVAKDIENGKGSLGLLIKDPTLYNELNGLIGNVRRNVLLKSIIRFYISNKEKSN